MGRTLCSAFQIGAVQIDQPIRVGIFDTSSPTYTADLEASSRGDAWIHPLDFVQSPTLMMNTFEQTEFTLECLGCQVSYLFGTREATKSPAWEGASIWLFVGLGVFRFMFCVSYLNSHARVF